MVTPDAAVAIYVRVGRLGEAQSILADWQKETRHSIATQACYAMKEPMNSRYLDDLRKAGLPEKEGLCPSSPKPFTQTSVALRRSSPRKSPATRAS